ncbi:hypothetical protein CIW83_02990 [Tissierella sp. P1]|nr:hypothetical protein CIW83_02990 [Tissierella sp. P1]
MDMEENEMLYIPIGLKENNEIWDGFGKKELIKSLITLTILLTINLLIFLIKRSVVFASVFTLVSIGGTGLIFTKDTTNLSVVDQVINMIRFAKSQKKYKYAYLDEFD